MVNPLANPIFRREYFVMARSKKAFLAALLLLIALSLILFMLWPRSGVLSQFDSNEIFSVFLTANLGIVILLVPAFTATAITEEREKGSFDLLFTTSLTPFEILFGKLASALAMVFTIVIISMPVTAICALSGGISVPLLLQTYGIIFLATLTYGLVGLAVSALFHRNFSSVMAAYAAIVLLAGAVWLPSVLLGQITPFHDVWMMLRSLSPFEALFALNQPARYEIEVGGGAFATSTLQFYTAGMLVLAAIAFTVFCVFVLRPPQSRKSKAQTQYSDMRTALKRRLVFPFYLIDPLKRKNPIARWRNPVFVAELRGKIFGHPKFLLRALATCIALSLIVLTLVCINFATVLGPDRVRLVGILFQFGVVILVAPVISSGSITEERASGTMVLLRMTPLSAFTVLIGKLKAAFMFLLIFLISSLPVLFSLAYLEVDAAYWRIPAWIATLLLSALVFIIMGLFASTIMKNTASATALSYTMTFVLTIVSLAVLLFGARHSSRRQSLHSTR